MLDRTSLSKVKRVNVRNLGVVFWPMAQQHVLLSAPTPCAIPLIVLMQVSAWWRSWLPS